MSNLHKKLKTLIGRIIYVRHANNSYENTGRLIEANKEFITVQALTLLGEELYQTTIRIESIDVINVNALSQAVTHLNSCLVNERGTTHEHTSTTPKNLSDKSNGVSVPSSGHRVLLGRYLRAFLGAL